MNVIIDTNLWISFLIGHQTQLVRRMLTDLDNLLVIINAYCQFATIEAEVAPTAICDPKDLYLLALADTIGADYIVSGDADLTDLGQYNQTRIMKLADFKAMIQYQ